MSDQNEMKPSENQEEENQEQEVGILQVCALCEGCIVVHPENGCAVREGEGSAVGGRSAHAEGHITFASGRASHSEGTTTKAIGDFSHAEGDRTTSNGRSSHAEGTTTTANEISSHAEGSGTEANGIASHSEGSFTMANGFASHAEGTNTVAVGISSHTEGGRTNAFSEYCHAEGLNTAAGVSGDPTRRAAHAEGELTRAAGIASHAEGTGTNANGNSSHAEGGGTQANGESSHAEGIATKALADASHAEGTNTTASGESSHAEGGATQASGESSHAEGNRTIASGDFSHAEGQRTVASGVRSHAEGLNTSTNGITGAHIMGRFGDATHTYSWHLANGTSETDRSLAAKIVNDGRGIADKGWLTGNADYAEMFETVDGKPMDVGYFVTFDGEKIRKANKKDNYILGIVSADPAILGDSGELRWKDKYVTDEWGRVQYRDVVIPAEKDQDGNVIVPERTEKQPILNPDWDDTKEYIPRSERPEWVAVGLLGKLRVRDDGTCQVNGYCRPNNEGIATASKDGYRVIKRTGPNQILVLFK
ncbi:autotransporter adhesin [Bacillus fengqiuensis]|nr:autotransporter adhesin [Bacillus fengqiuensis]